ncbi:hypothetical protein AX769_16480 [Frondihabitans sp. PAMC 28766]|nr:hypothetical protein AX769_16480 [Frondihabitans sp. PAMC 28766]
MTCLLVAAVAATAGGIMHWRVAVAQVPLVYLRAAEAHDCTLTEALSATDDERQVAWCGRRFSLLGTHPDLLSFKNIAKPIDEPEFGQNGPPSQCYPVDITETNMTGAQPGAMPGWQFCFIHTPAGWRLAQEGYG